MQRILNCEPTPRSDKDFLALPVSVADFPLEIDMEDQFPPVFNQLGLGACTANGAIALREFMQIHRAQARVPMSRSHNYWHTRSLIGTVGEDSGAYTRDALKVLVNTGVCEERFFPYDEHTYNNTPSEVAEQDAQRYKIAEYHRLTDYAQVMKSLVEGKPVLIGFAIYDSFWATGTTGIMAMPDIEKENRLGGHCVVAIGYKYINGELYFKIRNSWGTQWGINGHFWMPAEYVGSWLLAFDLWSGTLNTPYDDITYAQAIHILTDNEHIYDTPDFWLALGEKYKDDTTSDFRYVQLLLRKFAADAQNLPPLRTALDYSQMTFHEALIYLSGKMVMASPDFWLNMWDKYAGDETSDFRYLSLAIIKYAVRRKIAE